LYLKDLLLSILVFHSSKSVEWIVQRSTIKNVKIISLKNYCRKYAFLIKCQLYNFYSMDFDEPKSSTFKIKYQITLCQNQHAQDKIYKHKIS